MPILSFLKILTVVISVNLAVQVCFADCSKIEESDLSKKAIENLIHNPDCHVKSFEDLFMHLPKSYFDGYALMYRSESLQGPYSDDFLNPRAIVYGNASNEKNSSLIMTFNGSPSQSGYDSLEFVQVKAQPLSNEQNFQFFELAKSADGALVISDNNPPKCTRCHDSPAKPILSTYPKWPGSYGSLKFPDAETVTREESNYRSFREASISHPRYRFLTPVKDQNPYQKLEESVSQLGTTLLSSLVQRNARVVMSTPDYDKTKFAILSAFLQCPSWPSNVPAPVRFKLEKNIEELFDLKTQWPNEKLAKLFRSFYDSDDQREFPNHSATWVAKSYPEALKKLYFQFGPYPEYVRLQADTFSKQGLSEESSVPASLRLLMEGRGLRIGSLFLPLDQESYHVHEGLADYRELWLLALLRADPAFSEYAIRIKSELHNYENSSDSSSYINYDVNLCNDLAFRSQNSLIDLNVPDLTKTRESLEANYPPVFAETCSRCHSAVENHGAPPIPFDNEIEMHAWESLVQNRTKISDRIQKKSGRAMPPSHWITPAEQKQILRYLNI